MTESGDPFDDLEGALDDESDEPAADEGGTTADSTAEPQGEPAGIDEPEAGGPAFPFDAVTQRPLYVRDETWTLFEDVLWAAEAALREADVRDVESRELHDAALRVLEGRADEVAEEVEAARENEGER